MMLFVLQSVFYKSCWPARGPVAVPKGERANAPCLDGGDGVESKRYSRRKMRTEKDHERSERVEGTGEAGARSWDRLNIEIELSILASLVLT